jgi:hypothetical protein
MRRTLAIIILIACLLPVAGASRAQEPKYPRGFIAYDVFPDLFSASGREQAV